MLSAKLGPTVHGHSLDTPPIFECANRSWRRASASRLVAVTV
jgi:hypothetical protein